jgi:regulator of sigma E protease
MSFLLNLIGFLLILGVLIVVHEWGHFVAGRWAGAKIESFSIGFGPRIFFWVDRYGTEFRIAPFLLGGYVRFYGEIPGTVRNPHPGAFYNLPLKKRLMIVIAGPAMNALLAFALAPLLFSIGIPEPEYYHQPPEVAKVSDKIAPFVPPPPFRIVAVDGKEVYRWEDLNHLPWQEGRSLRIELVLPTEERREVTLTPPEPLGDLLFPYLPPVVHRVIPGMPAEKAGLEPGDRIIMINDQRILHWLQLTELMESFKDRSTPPPPLRVTFLRNGKEHEVLITPKLDPKRNQYLLGIERKEEKIRHSYPLLEAISMGWERVAEIFSLTYSSLFDLIFHQKGLEQLGGPIAIAQGAFWAQRQEGIYGWLFYLIFLSIQLAIFNLLPIPALDGGHVLIIFLEGAFRKPLPLWFLMGYQWIGFAFLILLLLFVTKLDLHRLTHSP